MRASGLLLGMLLLATSVSAQDEALPSMELLEFLGEWGDADPGRLAQELDDAATLAGITEQKPQVQSNEESKDDD